MKVISGGSSGYVSIGLAADGFPFARAQPGWRRDSFGYHGDDGNVFLGMIHLSNSTLRTDLIDLFPFAQKVVSEANTGLISRRGMLLGVFSTSSHVKLRL